jgi:hypothetical protein
MKPVSIKGPAPTRTANPMNKIAADRMTYFVVALGLIAMGTVYVWMGSEAAISTAIGVAVALLNWFIQKFIVGRMLSGRQKSQLGAAGLLFLKMGLLMAGLFVLLRSGFVQLIPFTVGFSTLVVGVIAGGLIQSLTAPQTAENER